MSAKGIWVTPTEYVKFGESKRSLAAQIATRDRSIDFFGLGMYLPNPDTVLKALGKDITVYRELRADAHVGGCVRRRKAAVKTLEWGLDRSQTKSRVAKSIEAIFADLDVSRIMTEMLDAVLYGYQPMEVMWGKVGHYIVPIDIVGKPADWFVYDVDNQLRFRSKAHRIQGEALPPRKFLVSRQNASYQNPYGFADLSMCFWPTTFKKGGLKFWVQFTEKYGAPWVIGKHPRSASDAETSLLLDRLEEMVQDAVAVIPDDSSISIEEAAGKADSADVYERLLYYCRSEVAIALLGSNQTTEASSTHASAKAGLEVTHDIRDGDKAIVVETLNVLIRWICELNFNDGPRPVFSMWQQEAVDEILAARDEKLVRAGARLTPAYFKRAYSLQEGDLDEQVTARAGDAKDVSSDFAEGEGVGALDQEVLDKALDTLCADAMNANAQAILLPIFKQIKNGVSPDTLLGVLADLYPDMDATGLQERLARALFVVNVWGRLHA